jgi:mannitol/fructose-specific phosphotransferase system IIA component (Ntr-type)
VLQTVFKYKRGDQMNLSNLIKKDHITFKKSVDSFEDAIYESGQVLLDKRIIEKKYLDKVIENVKTIGPYIVIAPMIALSHARPEDGANALGMSLLMLEEPINFSKDKDRKAKAIITLAASNENDHLDALSQMSKMLMENMESFLGAKDKETILKMIKNYS